MNSHSPREGYSIDLKQNGSRNESFQSWRDAQKLRAGSEEMFIGENRIA